MDRNKATSEAFVANVDTYLADVAAGDITTLDLDNMAFVNPGVDYNFDENRYEYIHGMGKAGTVLDGSEGWQLDILKAGWMTANSGYSPHGWRFSCRDRNDNVQGKILSYFSYFNHRFKGTEHESEIQIVEMLSTQTVADKYISKNVNCQFAVSIFKTGISIHVR